MGILAATQTRVVFSCNVRAFQSQMKWFHSENCLCIPENISNICKITSYCKVCLLWSFFVVVFFPFQPLGNQQGFSSPSRVQTMAWPCCCRTPDAGSEQMLSSSVPTAGTQLSGAEHGLFLWPMRVRRAGRGRQSPRLCAGTCQPNRHRVTPELPCLWKTISAGDLCRASLHPAASSGEKEKKNKGCSLERRRQTLVLGCARFCIPW